MPGNELWPLGVSLEIVSTMSGTVGKQLIRKSELVKDKKPSASRMFFYGGLLINTLCGPLLDMAAYSFAAQSLIAPFGGLDVVWNCAFAPLFLGERLTTGRVAGCFLLLVGTTMAGTFGNHNESEYTIEYIEDTLIKPRVAIYLGCFLAWFCLNRFYFMKFPLGSAIRGVSLGCTAGTIAGNMWCVKSAIELIQRSIHEQEGEIWLHWLPYVTLLGAVFFAVSNVGYMTQGLQEYEALFMVTIYEGAMIVSGCLSGAIVLLDLKGLEYWRVGLYWTGVCVIASGMYVIFKQEAHSKSSLLNKSASIVVEPADGGRASSNALRPRADSKPSDQGMLTKGTSFGALGERSIHANIDAAPRERGRASTNQSNMSGGSTGAVSTEPQPNQLPPAGMSNFRTPEDTLGLAANASTIEADEAAKDVVSPSLIGLSAKDDCGPSPGGFLREAAEKGGGEADDAKTTPKSDRSGYPDTASDATAEVDADGATTPNGADGQDKTSSVPAKARKKAKSEGDMLGDKAGGNRVDTKKRSKSEAEQSAASGSQSPGKGSKNKKKTAFSDPTAEASAASPSTPGKIAAEGDKALLAL